MAVAKEKNPIKIMSIVIIVLLVALIAITLFLKQKQKDGEIGYFFKKEDETPPATTKITSGLPKFPAGKLASTSPVKSSPVL